nr:hypothetical transcript [Hymenolepis microstoma]
MKEEIMNSEGRGLRQCPPGVAEFNSSESHHPEVNRTRSLPTKIYHTPRLKGTRPSITGSNFTTAFTPNNKLPFEDEISPSRTQTSRFLFQSISNGSPVRARTLKIFLKSQAIIAERKRQELVNPDVLKSSPSTTPVQRKSGILKGPASPKANKRVSFSGVRKVRYFLSPERRQLAPSGLPSSARDAVIETTISDRKEPETKSATELEVLTGSNANINRKTPEVCTEPEGVADMSADRTRIKVNDHSTHEDSKNTDEKACCDSIEIVLS